MDIQAVFIAGGARRFETATPHRRFTIMLTSDYVHSELILELLDSIRALELLTSIRLAAAR